MQEEKFKFYTPGRIYNTIPKESLILFSSASPASNESRLQGEHPCTDPAGHIPAPPCQGEWATRHLPGRWKGLTQEGQSKESHRRGVQPLSQDLHSPVYRKWSTYPWASARADRAGSDTFSAASPLVVGPCEQCFQKMPTSESC